MTFVFPFIVNGEQGYYRFPTIHESTIVFTAEGDLWMVSDQGGNAQRLTTHLGLEFNADISPDGQLIAFNAQYNGPTEIYVMPITGGIPQRITFEGESLGRYNPSVYGWTEDGRIIYSTYKYATLPNAQLVLIDPESLTEEIMPLQQANQGTFDTASSTLFFTRLPFQGSHTRRYKGGTAENIWKFSNNAPEAVPLTVDYTGTSRDPMYFNGRIYFSSDLDGTFNLWSMNENGSDRKQHSFSSGWDIKTPDIHLEKIIYQKGADLYLYNIHSDEEKLIPISLVSDFEQRRTRWIEDPAKTITHIDLSPDGKKIAVSARGRIFVAPVEGGRWAEITRKSGIRHQASEFINNETVAFISDESGEMEVWKSDIHGMSKIIQISSSNHVTILQSMVSPDGKWMCTFDKDYQLSLVNLDNGIRTTVNNATYEFADMSFSPDSKWLAYSINADNQSMVIHLYDINSGKDMVITTDRVDSYSPVWSKDGKWLYFLSDREFESLVNSPWGPRQPEPFFTETTRLYALSLYENERFPFLPQDELFITTDENKEIETDDRDKKKKKSGNIPSPDTKYYDVSGLSSRLYEVPLKGKNYGNLTLSDDHIYWTETDMSNSSKRNLFSLKISNDKDNEPILVAEDIQYFQLSDDQEKILLMKEGKLHVINAEATKADLTKSAIQLKDWTFKIDPMEDWKQLLTDAWRLERDYFWDRNLHGIDWQHMLEKHMPLVERITDRYELDDLMAHMVAELSTLHTFVYGGDKRESPVNIMSGSLGARLTRINEMGGYRIDYIYRSDPDFPEERSPLTGPHLKIKAGDIITAINGMDVLTAPHIAALMPEKAGQQVRLSMKHPDGAVYDEIITPISSSQERNLRYSDWELTRREITETESGEEIGYIHLRAMGENNYVEFLKNYYPVFNKKGLILDVRHNRGGNIDSWILEKLMRKAWFYWQPRIGQPYWNMQYAFRGHMVILCNEMTASDGEAVTEGFRRLGLGKVIGTRTWGGEVWLTSSNRLVDGGIATAAEFGVYDENGVWLIEGHGVDPDVVVDNLPHETFHGKDAQLEAAIEHLKQLIEADPRDVPPAPPYPDKSFDYSK